MPLFEDKVEIITNPNGDTQISCKHCHQAADDKARTDGEFPFLLMCPYGSVTLGEWRTATEREAGTNEFRTRT